ncbi:2OG-Fe(II) oxygenase family protein [Aphanothece sacrum]|uniref:Prolyl 4-hydroxylase alpha subunit Fe(2+) 2OG dioxygenase domain-containing protein n=1 Tax=Aphanothece sacrum FPU1 TaxID=1920663 RepID=A0A401IMS7_APHSA|nr:2OG-Fe(II) oxygenase [Aphanothece sacrum]GBF82549.1 hypothetical protein AsFPU1_3979 [Aphanothece sacrum FPU1]
MSYYHQHSQAFSPTYLSELQGQILASPYFTVNNLNRDFIGTKGFSLVFQRSYLTQVAQNFPYFKPYLNRVVQPECNAFYLNPLLLEMGSRVDFHIDRSLRSYCETITPPLVVSVLYIKVPGDLLGGELILRSNKKQLAQIRPQVNNLVFFQGDLSHGVNPVKSSGIRLSLVCEQYNLDDEQLREIPDFKLESRAIKSEKKANKSKKRR